MYLLRQQLFKLFCPPHVRVDTHSPVAPLSGGIFSHDATVMKVAILFVTDTRVAHTFSALEHMLQRAPPSVSAGTRA